MLSAFAKLTSYFCFDLCCLLLISPRPLYKSSKLSYPPPFLLSLLYQCPQEVPLLLVLWPQRMPEFRLIPAALLVNPSPPVNSFLRAAPVACAGNAHFSHLWRSISMSLRVRCDLKDLPFTSAGPHPPCSNCKERGLKCVSVYSYSALLHLKVSCLAVMSSRMSRLSSFCGAVDVCNKSSAYLRC